MNYTRCFLVACLIISIYLVAQCLPYIFNTKQSGLTKLGQSEYDFCFKNPHDILHDGLRVYNCEVILDRYKNEYEATKEAGK